MAAKRQQVGGSWVPTVPLVRVASPASSTVYKIFTREAGA